MNAGVPNDRVTRMYPGLDASALGTVIVDLQQPDQPLIYVNPAFERLTGYAAAEILGRNCRVLQGEDRDQAARHDLRRAIGAGQPITVMVRNYRQDGTPFLNEVSLTPLRDGGGAVTHVMGFSQDVTERERLRAIADRNPDPLMSFDQDWTMTYVNAAAAAVAGRPPEALIGQPLLGTYPEVAGTPPFEAAQRALDTGEHQHVKTYSEAMARALETTAYVTDGGVTVMLHDVTAERQAVLEVQTSQDKFAKVFHASPLPIMVTRLADGRFVDANPAFLQLTGYGFEDLIGVSALDLYADAADRAVLLQRLGEGRPIVDHHVSYRVKSGAISNATIAVVPADIGGEPCIVTLLRDVTDERAAQERLAASEQHARHLSDELKRTLDLSLDMIITFDQERRFVTVSAACERLLGYRPDELIGRSYLDFLHPDDRARSLEGSRTLRSARQLTTFQNRYLRKNGSVVWLDWSAVRQPSGLTFAVARDVTDRRAAIEDQAFLAAIVQASPDAIIGLTVDGTVRAWNAGAERMYGYPATEMVGHQITEIVPPELLDEEAGLLARAAEGKYTPAIETVRVSRTGARIPVQLSIAPIFDRDGTVIGTSKIAQDITGRRDAARQILQLNATLQRKLNHLTGLRAIDHSIASGLDLNLTLGVVLEQVLAQVGVDAATAQLLDPHSLTLSLAASRGVQAAALDGSAQLGQGMSGRAALTRQPQILHDLHADAVSPGGRAWAAREGFTAYATVPMIAKGKVLGVLGVFRRDPFDAGSEWLETLQTLAGQAAIAIDNAQLFQELERSNLELGLAYQETIEGWAHALDLRDHETEGHSRRVTELTVELCRALGVSPADLVHVRRGALLHDIGKMGIADAILLKPGPLTDEEWVEMRRHPEYAVELLSPIHFLRPALDIPRSHHEKWDGSGYPQGLKGAAIPLTARAFAVVDVYDALTNDRPYRPAWSRERALAYLEEQSGNQFDPQVVPVMLTLMNRAGGVQT